MKKSSLIILLIVALLSISGCRTEKDETMTENTVVDENSPAKKEAIIGIMQHNRNDAFQEAMLKGAKDTAYELGYEIIDATSDDDPVRELEIIRNFAKEGVTLLILGSTTRVAGEAGIELAHGLGMKVVTMDSIQTESKADGQVGGDDIAAGYYAAKRLAETMGGRGLVAISKFPDPIPPSEDRVAGFYQAFSEYPHIQVIAEESTKFNTIEAMEWTKEMIRRYPEVSGFISIEDTSARGIIRGIEELGLEDEIKSVTVVESEEIYIKLKDGVVLDGVFAMHSYNYGSMSVFLLDSLNHGRPIPFIVKTTGVLVTKENVDENLEYLKID